MILTAAFLAAVPDAQAQQSSAIGFTSEAISDTMCIGAADFNRKLTLWLVNATNPDFGSEGLRPMAVPCPERSHLSTLMIPAHPVSWQPPMAPMPFTNLSSWQPNTNPGARSKPCIGSPKNRPPSPRTRWPAISPPILTSPKPFSALWIRHSSVLRRNTPRWTHWRPRRWCRPTSRSRWLQRGRRSAS